MKTIYLVRHGDKVRTIGDPPLSEVGIKQAVNTGIYLQQFPIDAIYTSPLRRTQETAQFISNYTGIPFTIEENLRERMNWGDNPSQTMDEFLKEWEHASNNRTFTPTSGDSSQKAGERLEEVIKNAIKQDHENIVLVAHGGIITDFLRNTFEERELDASYKDFSKIRDLAVKECSITTLSVKDGKYYLERIADTKHLS